MFIVMYPLKDKKEGAQHFFNTSEELFGWMQDQVNRFDGLPEKMRVFKQVFVTSREGGGGS